jgi:hypothetical protein
MKGKVEVPKLVTQLNRNTYNLSGMWLSVTIPPTNVQKTCIEKRLDCMLKT